MIKDVENIVDLTGSDKYKRLFRINYGGLRLYIENVPFRYFSGLTGALGAAKFSGNIDGKILKNWRERFIDNFGMDNANNYLQATADFGTLLHQALVRIKDKKEINWVEEKEMAEEYFHAMFLQAGPVDISLVKQTAFEYQKQVGSLMQFIHDRVQTIYAIEVPVIWDELHIATPVDLVCSCRQTPQGDFKDTVINIKTSSQIGHSQMEQVACELIMWNQTYDQPCEYSAILRTKDWNEDKIPTYEYKYQDISTSMDLAGNAYNRLRLCLQDGRSTYLPSPKNKMFEGVSKIGEKPNVVTKDLEQEWTEYWEKLQENQLTHAR